jgi:hypothetical protein
MIVEFFDPTENTSEISGPFGWIWMEGDELRAGPGPEFGNADPSAVAICYRETDGTWVSYATNNKFRDFSLSR